MRRSAINTLNCDSSDYMRDYECPFQAVSLTGCYAVQSFEFKVSGSLKSEEYIFFRPVIKLPVKINYEFIK